MEQNSNEPRLWRPGFTAVCVVVMVMFGYALFDRFNLMYGESYPLWMTRANLGAVDAAKVVSIRAGECSHEPIEVFKKRDGYVLRCGYTFLEPSTRTYFADSFDMGNGYRKGDKE